MVLFLAFALLGAPFEDTQKRFSIDLPEGWAFAPQPGDTTGASFRRVAEDVPANLMVRVIPVRRATRPGDVMARLGAGLRAEKGFSQVLRDTAPLGSATAERWRFILPVGEGNAWKRMIEQRAIVVGESAYLVHVETLAETFAFFEQDFHHAFASFQPGTGKGGVSVPAVAKALVGTWRTADGLTLDLRADGTFSLGEMSGTFAVRGDHLMLRMGNQGEETFQYDMKGRKVLILSGAKLPEPVRYRRVGGK